MVNTDEELVVAVLTGVRRLYGDHFGHMFGRGQMIKLNVFIGRDLYGVGENDLGNGRKSSFLCMIG